MKRALLRWSGGVTSSAPSWRPSTPTRRLARVAAELSVTFGELSGYLHRRAETRLDRR